MGGDRYIVAFFRHFAVNGNEEVHLHLEDYR